ncbi:MAG: type II toxin-antitoxin system RelE/ParE family toxin [Candidatus Omnitrophica bacterium]|nr:type II toxin-antitoxin system RelE/ParE family toxin [Candidatus Omnitrophota bacterium]
MIQFLFRTKRFKKDFRRLPHEIQDRTAKVFELFRSNPRHPSLHVKKMEGTQDIWELRVSDNYRITFQFVQEGVLLRRIGTHDILREP